MNINEKDSIKRKSKKNSVLHYRYTGGFSLVFCFLFKQLRDKSKKKKITKKTEKCHLGTDREKKIPLQERIASSSDGTLRAVTRNLPRATWASVEKTRSRIKVRMSMY